MTNKKKPFYGKRIRNQVIEAYFSSSASSEIDGYQQATPLSKKTENE